MFNSHYIRKASVVVCIPESTTVLMMFATLTVLLKGVYTNMYACSHGQFVLHVQRFLKHHDMPLYNQSAQSCAHVHIHTLYMI